jgi:pimeloyl-ACP methyl ester carboxylesterase
MFDAVDKFYPTALLSIFVIILAMLSAWGEASPVHSEVLVLVPAYEGSQLFDPTLDQDKSDPRCVWGNYNVFLSSKLYFALRQPNLLAVKPMMAVGPIDVYRGFVKKMTEPNDDVRSFTPYKLGTDFFVFSYDWRQEIATVSAPTLARGLESYAKIHELKTGIPAKDTRFIIVTHSMGGLVARTLISEKPEWAERISRLYLVGSPNDGSVKAIRTVIVGPDSIKEYAKGFPGTLLNLLPTDVDQNVTKLVGITRPSLYELLPYTDPNWQVRPPNDSTNRISADEVLKASSWEQYWPSADLEKRLFLDGWLKDREREGRKTIDPASWAYCQAPTYAKLKELLSEVRAWRQVMGPLSHTQRLLTRNGEKTRLRVIVSTGLKTPSGVISTGAHDSSQAYYTFDSKNDGDGTMEAKRVIDDISPNSPIIEKLHGVPHGRLMIDSSFLSYFTQELSGGSTVPLKAQPVKASVR